MKALLHCVLLFRLLSSMRHVSFVLQGNRVITELDVAICGIGVEGAIAVARLLKVRLMIRETKTKSEM